MIWCCRGLVPQRELNLPRARARSAPSGAPVVVSQVASPEPARQAGVDALDRPRKASNVEAVNAEVAERIAGAAVLGRQRAARVGRIERAAQDVDRDQVTERAGAHLVERVGSADRKSSECETPTSSPRLSQIAQPHAVLGVGGERLLDEAWQPASSARSRPRRACAAA